MQWVLWMVAVAVLGLAAVAASGRLGELPGTVTDTPRPHVPTGVLTGDDLRGLRFAVVPRGYSMDQVDELLDRLARQLDGGPAVSPEWQGFAQPAPDEPAVEVAVRAPAEAEPTEAGWASGPGLPGRGAESAEASEAGEGTRPG
ncbi:MAG: DivIVA domain-containing protein [Micropruina sp.]|uniref:DivIVA domain-containing protein n=1 Tax=Micropruina sp. TaxID=2737536 RepID=UPI0039E28838